MIDLIDAATRSALILSIALVGFGAASAALAQASVMLQQNVTVYRAFYYDASDNLLHVEVVRNADGRFLQPLLSAPRKAAPPVPPTEPSTAVLVGDKVRYAVYYGLDSSQPRARPGQRDVQLRALAIENLSEADASRPIECASPGGDACLFPRMCHCGAIGGCCCY
jgi:hypothetical protein